MANLAKQNFFDWKQIHSDLELQLRSGLGKSVRDELRKYPSEVIPQDWLGPFASLARRAGIPGTAVKILHPLVRLPSGNLATGFRDEKKEYAASLIEIGVLSEANDLLEELGYENDLELMHLMTKIYFAHRNYRPLLLPLEKSFGSIVPRTTPLCIKPRWISPLL